MRVLLPIHHDGVLFRYLSNSKRQSLAVACAHGPDPRRAYVTGAFIDDDNLPAGTTSHLTEAEMISRDARVDRLKLQCMSACTAGKSTMASALTKFKAQAAQVRVPNYGHLQLACHVEKAARV